MLTTTQLGRKTALSVPKLCLGTMNFGEPGRGNQGDRTLGIDDAPMNSYRFEQGFTYELNLQGHGDEARDAFLRGERDANSAAD